MSKDEQGFLYLEGGA